VSATVRKIDDLRIGLPRNIFVNWERLERHGGRAHELRDPETTKRCFF
jgi:hypothetical protein